MCFKYFFKFQRSERNARSVKIYCIKISLKIWNFQRMDLNCQKFRQKSKPLDYLPYRCSSNAFFLLEYLLKNHFSVENFTFFSLNFRQNEGLFKLWSTYLFNNIFWRFILLCTMQRHEFILLGIEKVLCGIF